MIGSHPRPDAAPMAFDPQRSYLDEVLKIPTPEVHEDSSEAAWQLWDEAWAQTRGQDA